MHACACPSVCACKFNEQTTWLYPNQWINFRENRRLFFFPKEWGLSHQKPPKNCIIATFFCVDMRIGTNNIVWLVCLYLGLFCSVVCACVCMRVYAADQHNGNDWSWPPPPPAHNSVEAQTKYPSTGRSLPPSHHSAPWKRCHNIDERWSRSMRSHDIGAQYLHLQLYICTLTDG